MNRMKTTSVILILLLIPLLCFSQSGQKTIPRVSFDFIDADVKNVLRILSEVSGKNIVISDAVKGKVTMKLDNVYWDEALDIVTATTGLRKIETDSIVRVVTTKEFDDERKGRDVERDAFRKERLEQQKLGRELVNETVYLSYANTVDMEKMLRGGVLAAAGGTAQAGTAARGFLSEFGNITQVPWNNALILRDTKENVSAMVQIVREHDIKPTQI